jgi:hypothetical protein
MWTKMVGFGTLIYHKFQHQLEDEVGSAEEQPA